jgi:hypothetical protein
MCDDNEHSHVSSTRANDEIITRGASSIINIINRLVPSRDDRSHVSRAHLVVCVRFALVVARGAHGRAQRGGEWRELAALLCGAPTPSFADAR